MIKEKKKKKGKLGKKNEILRSFEVFNQKYFLFSFYLGHSEIQNIPEVTR